MCSSDSSDNLVNTTIDASNVVLEIDNSNNDISNIHKKESKFELDERVTVVYDEHTQYRGTIYSAGRLNQTNMFIYSVNVIEGGGLAINHEVPEDIIIRPSDIPSFLIPEERLVEDMECDYYDAYNNTWYPGKIVKCFLHEYKYNIQLHETKTIIAEVDEYDVCTINRSNLYNRLLLPPVEKRDILPIQQTNYETYAAVPVQRTNYNVDQCTISRGSSYDEYGNHVDRRTYEQDTGIYPVQRNIQEASKVFSPESATSNRSKLEFITAADVIKPKHSDSDSITADSTGFDANNNPGPMTKSRALPIQTTNYDVPKMIPSTSMETLINKKPTFTNENTFTRRKSTYDSDDSDFEEDNEKWNQLKRKTENTIFDKKNTEEDKLLYNNPNLIVENSSDGTVSDGKRINKTQLLGILTQLEIPWHEIDEIKKFVNDTFTTDLVSLTSTHLDIISSYLNSQKMIYTESSYYTSTWLNYLMIPTIIISAGASVISGAERIIPHAQLIISCITAFSAFLLSVINYLKLDAASEAHKISAHQYDKLQSHIMFFSGKTLLFSQSAFNCYTRPERESKRMLEKKQKVRNMIKEQQEKNLIDLEKLKENYKKDKKELEWEINVKSDELLKVKMDLDILFANQNTLDKNEFNMKKTDIDVLQTRILNERERASEQLSQIYEQFKENKLDKKNKLK